MALIHDVLQQAGLDEKEAQVYTTLLNNGGLTVLEIATKSGQNRTNLYNILENLKQQGLVKESKEESTTKYYPESPKVIENLILNKQQMMRHAKLNYEILLESLISKYRYIQNQPMVNQMEGVKGLKNLYQDVIDTGKDILLFRSGYDSKPEVINIVAKQMADQVKRGIHARVIGPVKKDQLSEAKELYTKYDEARLVEERFIRTFDFMLEAQIIIYGNKIAVSTLKDEVFTTIIDNEKVTNTFRTLFEYIWQLSEKEHLEITKGWDKIPPTGN